VLTETLRISQGAAQSLHLQAQRQMEQVLTCTELQSEQLSEPSAFLQRSDERIGPVDYFAAIRDLGTLLCATQAS